MRRYNSPLALALSLPFAATLHAQGNAGISGTVSDPSGAAVPAAKISFVEQSNGTARVVNSDAAGYYTISPLSPGTYRLLVEAPGFERYEQTGVALRVDERLRVDAMLHLGEQKDIISVSGEAIAVNTADGVIRSVVDVKRMVDLPLNGRSPLQLMLLAPGVLPSHAVGLGTSFQPSGQQFVASSGSKANEVNFVLDGGDNMDTYREVANAFPNPDILQEFSVQTNSYSAEFGGRAGGVVNAVTKSGTNSLHGTLFEFVRNYDLNARNFFAATGDGLKRNQYGGTVGGPVWIPHLYDGRNRTFFFFGAQQTSVRQTPATTSARVFSQPERNGDFSDLRDGRGNPIAIKDPVNGGPFPGNVIPTSRLNPVFQNFLKLIPTAPDSSGIVRYVVQTVNDESQYSVRVDHNFTRNDRFFARFFKDNYLQPNEGVAGNFLSYTNSVSNGRRISPLITRRFLHRRCLPSGASRSIAQTVCGGRCLLPRGAISARLFPRRALEMIFRSPSRTTSASRCSGTRLWWRNNFEYKGSLGWVKGSHSLRFGMNAIRRQYSIPSNDVQFHGNFAFGAALSGDNGTDAVLGLPSSFVQDTGYQVALRETDWVGWVTDDFKVSRRLTLNLGLRYEPFLPWVDTWTTIPQIAQFRPGAHSQVYPNAPAGLLFYGDPGVSKHMAQPSYNRFAPRLGFAFDPTGNGKTSVRGGYGFFNEVLLGTEQIQQYASQLPVFTAVSSFSFPPGAFPTPTPAVRCPSRQ